MQWQSHAEKSVYLYIKQPITILCGKACIHRFATKSSDGHTKSWASYHVQSAVVYVQS